MQAEAQPPENSPGRIFLSVIIPAYNEEKRLPKTLQEVIAFLAAQPYSSEIIVVENGSSDNTADVAQEFARQHPIVRLLHSRQGKGIAVKTGMLAAHGDYLFICDADLSMPIGEVAKFLPPRLTDFDIAIASREMPGAHRYGEPAYRHFMGRVFNMIVRMLAIPHIRDTQCGFKCFRHSVAQAIFPLQTIDGWTFDVELLYIAQRHNYRLVEVPVNWYYRENSRIKPMQDTLNMLRDLLRIRQQARTGRYNSLLGGK